MEINEVKSAYKTWAPFYDKTFGLLTSRGSRRIINHINKRSGKVLEVGVGTGISLQHYSPDLAITGIDVSSHMLARARQKVADKNLSNVEAIHEMDARKMDFPDNHFDTVVAMYLVSVVPEPERVVAEMARVCKPGGEVLILNHFAAEKGAMAKIERFMAPFSGKIGWHSDFSILRVTGEDQLEIKEQKKQAPLGMFTFLRMVKKPLDA